MIRMATELAGVASSFREAYERHVDVNDGVNSYVLLGEFYDVFCTINDQNVIAEVLSIMEAYYTKGSQGFKDAVDVSFLELYVIDKRDRARLPVMLGESAMEIWDATWG